MGPGGRGPGGREEGGSGPGASKVQKFFLGIKTGLFFNPRKMMDFPDLLVALVPKMPFSSSLKFGVWVTPRLTHVSVALRPVFPVPFHCGYPAHHPSNEWYGAYQKTPHFVPKTPHFVAKCTPPPHQKVPKTLQNFPKPPVGVLGGVFDTIWGGCMGCFLVHFGVFWYIFFGGGGASVQFLVGVYGTIRGFLWYNSGGFRYTSGGFQYISSGFCRMFSGIFF